MILDNFKLHAIPQLDEAYCTNKKCKKKSELFEVSNGLLGAAWFCPDCESVYILKLERFPLRGKKHQNFLEQCRKEYKADQAGREARYKVMNDLK